MKTLILIDDLLPGGTESNLYALLKFRSKDHAAKVVTLYGEGPVRASLESIGVEVHLLNLKQGFFKSFFRLRRLSSDWAPDNVICLRHGARALFPWLFRLMKISKIVMRWENPKMHSSFLQRFLEGIQTYFATDYEATSEEVATEIRRRYYLKRVLVIPNCIDIKSFETSPRSFRRDRLELITVGNLRREKQYSEQIKILDELRRLNVAFSHRIVGEGTLRPEIEAKVRSQSLENQVQLAGMQTLIKPLLEGADIFLFTSASEGFGVAIIEALAAGLPCVIYDISILSQIDPHREALQVIPQGDYQNAAQRIKFLWENPEERKKISRKGILLAERFDARNVVKRWEAAYDKAERL